MKFDKKQNIIYGFFLFVIVAGFTIKKVLPPWHPARNWVHLLFGILFLLFFLQHIQRISLKAFSYGRTPRQNPPESKKGIILEHRIAAGKCLGSLPLFFRLFRIQSLPFIEICYKAAAIATALYIETYPIDLLNQIKKH